MKKYIVYDLVYDHFVIMWEWRKERIEKEFWTSTTLWRVYEYSTSLADYMRVNWHTVIEECEESAIKIADFLTKWAKKQKSILDILDDKEIIYETDVTKLDSKYHWYTIDYDIINERFRIWYYKQYIPVTSLYIRWDCWELLYDIIYNNEKELKEYFNI